MEIDPRTIMPNQPVPPEVAVRRTLRHVVEVPDSAETGDRLVEMTDWCASRFGRQGWIRLTRAEGPRHYAQFRFREPGMADAFEQTFRGACAVRCRS